MKTSTFNVADYLDSEEMIAEYLNTVLEEGDDVDLEKAVCLLVVKYGNLMRYLLN